MQYLSVQVQYIDIYYHINIHIHIHIYETLHHISVPPQYISVPLQYSYSYSYLWTIKSYLSV